MSKLIFLFGLIAICNASIEILPAVQPIVRSIAAPSVSLTLAPPSLSLSASIPTVSRALWAAPSYAYAEPSYTAVRSLLPALYSPYYL